MGSHPIGPNEARVLSVLVRAMTIDQICDRLEGDALDEGTIDDASVYLCLKRLVDRGLICRRTVSRRTADGKMRNVGEYTATPEAAEALRAWYRSVAPTFQRLSRSPA